MKYQRLVALLPPTEKHPHYSTVEFLLNLETNKLDMEVVVFPEEEDTVLDIDPITAAAIKAAEEFNQNLPEEEPEDGL